MTQPIIPAPLILIRYVLIKDGDFLGTANSWAVAGWPGYQRLFRYRVDVFEPVFFVDAEVARARYFQLVIERTQFAW